MGPNCRVNATVSIMATGHLPRGSLHPGRNNLLLRKGIACRHKVATLALWCFVCVPAFSRDLVLVSGGRSWQKSYQQDRHVQVPQEMFGDTAQNQTTEPAAPMGGHHHQP